MPDRVEHAWTIQGVPANVTPFEAPFAGDGTGAVAFLVETFPANKFRAAFHDPEGEMVGAFDARNADTFRLRILPQETGFQVLTGDTINTAQLDTLSPEGALVRRTPLQRAASMATTVDPDGGAVVVALRLPGGSDPSMFTYPWQLFVHRFDQSGRERHDGALVAADLQGTVRVGDFAAAANRDGRAFVVWSLVTTKSGSGPYPILGAWIERNGMPRSPFSIGIDAGPTNLDAEALADGSVAISAGHAWRYRIPDGQDAVAEPGWLAQFPRTRLALVRGGRAYVVLQGNPLWNRDGALCQTTVPLTLVATDGTTCGTIELPPPVADWGECLQTISSAALARDGSVIVRTLEALREAPDRPIQYWSFARSWPRLLR